MSDARGVGAPVALIILDGWGVAPAGPGNAVDLAVTPNFDAIAAASPYTTMVASGTDVGLPPGQIGNSEVGHLNLGAGRVVHQDLTRIDRAIELGELASNEVLRRCAAHARAATGTVHIIGLCSTGGVHSSLDHITALVEQLAADGVARVLVHAITDGRDVAPDASLVDIARIESALTDVSARMGCDARVVTVIGRYWAMDRDRRWDRTTRAWDAIIHGRASGSAATADAAVHAAHAAGTTDEFIEPTTVGAGVVVADGDAVLLANFRPDRMRQLVHALVDDDAFDGFDRGDRPAVDVTCMAEYDESLTLPVLFAPSHVRATLADVLERAGLAQLHVAETEKYAHVTYFFNGGVERIHREELRELVPSPRDVATYDLRPEMSCVGVADAVIDGIEGGGLGFVVVNFANPDMVGHTGSIPAAIAACEAVDEQLGRVLDALRVAGGCAIVTADHGNAECMLTDEGRPHTAHTTNPVPVVLVGGPEGATLRSGGRLADVAPTLLDLLDVEQPNEMDGQSLLVRAAVASAS